MGEAARGSEPASARFRRPAWRDPRLLTGLLLVLLSVAGVVAVVAATNRTDPYLAAARDIEVGQAVTAEDVVAVDVRLQDAGSLYVPADAAPGPGTVAVQRIAEGQLLPGSALATADRLDRKPVGIPVAHPLPGDARPGSRVDVWVAAPKASGRGYEAARLLLPAAEIASVEAEETALGAGRGTVVHVLVEDEPMEELVDALGNDARVTLVWNPAGRAR
ncbi:flagellar protein FlgA [Kocuria dechangensis]|uniref:Flagellar protein FlgA n=1 Tax=Kocuria dechangensis TaxID=1176249 RepID=A0A917GLC3_9MICC|nr:SAF domain-containing protein [Kocuria dechangensis]GGG49963.1 flagellar protein FlgA [Kocuria dechangensis]